MSCGPFAKCCQHQSLESENWFQTYKSFLVSSPLLTRAQGVKNLSYMHCDHVLFVFVFFLGGGGEVVVQRLVTSLSFLFHFNIIHVTANKKRSIETQICNPACIDFISNRHYLQHFKLLGSAAMEMYGDLYMYVEQKGQPVSPSFLSLYIAGSFLSEINIVSIKGY